MKLALFALMLLLTACATNRLPRPVMTKEVDVPVIYSCKPDLPLEPQYPDTDAALLNLPTNKSVPYQLFYSVRLMAAGRLMREARIHQLTTALEGCIAQPDGTGQ